MPCAPLYGGALRRPPVLQQLRVERMDLNAERPADRERVLRLGSPQWHREVAAGTGREGAEKIDLGEELDVIALLGRAGAHEIPVGTVEAGALEDVQHVMDVELGQPVRRHRAHQVGVAVEVEILAGQHAVDVGIAARAQQIVDAAAELVDAIVLETVRRDGHDRPQVRQGRPQAIEDRDMRSLQLARPGGPQALPRIVQVPDVKVADLRSLDRDDTEDVPRRHLPGTSGADRDGEFLDQRATGSIGDAAIEILVDSERRALVRLIGGRMVFHACPLSN